MQKQKFSSLVIKKQNREKTMGVISNFKIIIYCLAIVSLLSYLIVVNRTNTMGYEIAEMQMRIKALKEQHRDLQSQATQLQSLPRIKEISNATLNMVVADNFDYILPAKASVVVGR